MLRTHQQKLPFAVPAAFKCRPSSTERTKQMGVDDQVEEQLSAGLREGQIAELI